MIPTIKCVFDTNALISGALFEQSIPAQAVFLALQQHTLLASHATLREVSTVLRRSKFDAYVSVQDRERFLTRIALKAELVDIIEHITVCRDAKDNKFLDVAVNGQATVLISGDDDLLTLHPFRTIPIIRPHDFLQQYQDR